ncbi:MAG: Mth938-like domain-containing protein [Burkholderiaceae bacterium]
MKLHEHAPLELNTITAYGTGFIEVNARRHQGAVLVMPGTPPSPWAVRSLDDIDEGLIGALLEFGPELVLIGTGARQQFLHPRLLAPLTNARVGHETMTTDSACRTYNILMAEGRQVLAALLPIAD